MSNQNTKSTLSSERSSARESKAGELVRNHVIAATAMGLVPVPAIDFVGLTLIQCRMLKGLCEIYDQPYSANQAKSWILSVAGGYTSTYVGSRLLMSWLKVIPGVSLATGTSAAVVTYALGLLFRRHFRNGGTPDTVDVKAMKDQFKDDVKTATQDLKKSPATDAPITQAQASDPDDLTVIEGIGPKLQQVLGENDINTFAALAATPISELEAILLEAGPRFKLCRPDTWAEQATLAQQEDFGALAALKDELKHGVRAT